MSVKVMVLGPNGLSDCTFHVHEASCRDLWQPKYRRVDGSPLDRHRTWVFEADSVQEIIEDLFSDFIGENGEDDTWENYAHDAKIFPCVGLE